MSSRVLNSRPLSSLRLRRLFQAPPEKPWICASCRYGKGSARPMSRHFQKPYYVTTPIFYVNAAPHIGHMYTMILADILKRWQELMGKKAILVTGTDEYGLKIQRAAAAAGVDPQTFCNKGAQIFKTLAERCQISYDTFIRTTDAAHREAVQHFWFLLQQRGYIYSSKHEGWYSVSDETFYPESGVHLILDPPTGRKMMASIETGKEVEWTSEINYHFKLSEFQQPLLKFYKERYDWIRPKERMKYIIQQVEEGLEDLSVSRPSERLHWGVPVPDDPSQTIYVWLDALINYITAAGYPWTPGRENVLGWPANVQVIGKDIIRFHCIYWPAFLMALDIPLPNQFLAHAHWTLGNTGKMSKSSGNVVNPFFALDRFGVDTMRFYLAHDGGLRDDAAYDNRFIIEKYKKNLQGGLGNLASRVLRGKGWNVKRCIIAVRELMRDSEPTELTDKGMYRDLVMMPQETAKKMQHEDIAAALKTIFSLIHNTNRYLQARSPWHLSSTLVSPNGSSETYASATPTLELETCIFLCAEALRISGILLQPFVPGKADQLLNMLGVEKERRSFEWTELGKDDLYGIPWVDLGKGERGVLFPPLGSDY